MSRYAEIDAIITALGAAATADEMELALRDYPDRDVRTVLAERAAAGGGGAGPFLSETVPLTHAQILGLPTTPVQLLTAPPAGTFYLPIVVVAVVDSSGGYYDNVDGECIMRITDTACAPLYEGGNTKSRVSTFLGAEDLMYATFLARQWNKNAANWEQFAGTGTLSNLDDGLQLLVDNGLAGDFTAGDPANSGSVTVVYMTLTP